MSARQRYRELCAKVDAFTARVMARHGDQMACRAGCDACCRTRLSVTALEAEEIRAAVAALPSEAVRRLATRAAADPPHRCAALEDDGRCAIYHARPLVCRSHGVPIRMRAPGSLPVVTSCEKNFTARGPEAADADCVLDQATLSVTLAALAAAHAGETGGGAAAEARIAIADLLADAARPR